MAVAALATVSCTTDVTEDLGVQLGNDEGQTTLTLSLEASRTQLGEKSGDIYPLGWSEGDAIAVNGVASAALGAEAAGAGTANFTFAATLDRPYNIVYPAPKEDAKVIVETIKETVTETTIDPETGAEVTTSKEVDKEVEVTLYPITFPAEQTYAGAKLADGAAPMYGYAAPLAEGEVVAPIQINHLTGILNFNIKGSESLSKIVVTSERGAISGTYYVRCETGQLVVKEESTSNQVTLSFGAGLALSAEEATPIFVTVPAGNYGVFVATIHTVSGKKMAVRFDSNEKPISVGKVREFAPFTFVENTVEEAIFEIYDFADLQKFAQIASAAKFYPRVEAKLMENIVVPEGAEWTPVEGFRHTFNGNNKSIIGLPAPLFGTTSATIKDLTLEGVALVSNGELIMGTIANTLTSASQAVKASITNCKAVGTFSVSNTEWVPTSDEEKSAKVVNYGGLVGRALGADVIDCTNQVALTVDYMTAASSTKIVYSAIAGVVGYVAGATLQSGESVDSNITNCTNDAAVCYYCKSTAESKAQTARPHIGGVVGCGNSSSNITGCENTAKGIISLNSRFYSGGGASGGVPVGGVAGYNNGGDFKNNVNRGKVEADGLFKSINIGGVGGYITYCYNDECHNYGEVVVKETARIRGILAGGVAGAFYGDGSKSANDQYFQNCTNNAPLKILASAEENWVNSADANSVFYYRIGGITGFGRIKTSGGCINNGDITISGDVKIAARSEYDEEAIAIAGCVGFKTCGTPSGVWTNNGDITVDASFTFDDDTVGSRHPIAIAGVFGPHSGINAECNNNGDILFNGQYAGTTAAIHIGGVYAGGNSDNSYYKNTPKKAKNTGDITFGAEASTQKNVYVGGIQAYSTSTVVPEKFENTGNITFDAKATIGGILYTGGIFGRYVGGALKNLTNSGNLTVNCNLSGGKLAIAGIAPYYITGVALTDITNTGNITVTGTYKKGINVGGILAEMKKGETGKLTRVVNGALGADGKPANDKGKILISGTSNYNTDSSGESALCMAGLFGACNYDRRPGNMEDCHNYGDMEMSGTITGRIYFNGMSMACLNADRTVLNCSQEGDLTVSGTLKSASKSQMYLGGFSYTMDKAIVFTNYHNKGNITVTSTAKIQSYAYIMGVGGYRTGSVTYDGCSNSGDIVFAGEFTYGGSLYMSALAAQRFGAMTIKNGFTNSGKVAFTGKATAKATINISSLGVVYGTTHKLTEAGIVKNTGEIAFTGSATNTAAVVYLGGLFSQVPASVTALVATDAFQLLNLGKVTFTGSVATPANAHIGGLVGTTLSPINGAKCYCEMNVADGYTYGWITGSERVPATPLVLNCHLGGYKMEYDPRDEEEREVPAFDKTNYHEYIYGNGINTDWTGTTNYDGCEYLPSSPLK